MTDNKTRLAMEEDFYGVKVIIIADDLPPLEIIEGSKSSEDDRLPGITKTSGITVQDFFEQVGIRNLVKSVVKGFGEDMKSLQDNIGSSEIELELSLSLAAGNNWIFVKTEGHVKLKMVWKNKNERE